MLAHLKRVLNQARLETASYETPGAGDGTQWISKPIIWHTQRGTH